MNFNGAMRKECVTTNEDGTYTVKGSGWFWCRIKQTPQGLAVVETAPDMMAKKAASLFVTQAKRTIEKYFA